MPVDDDLATVQRCLDDLCHSVGRLEARFGTGALEMRRVRTDADHLRESLALLREAAPGLVPAPRPPTTAKAAQPIGIPDTPYDSTLWTDSDDEGLGARGRHAP
ncbi:hypothetical protein OK074_0972 [Actinobacteria bacterium OK074]|nr:hypothetical protein OK074_0972 [Actinobacteria bacterium OK074]